MNFVAMLFFGFFATPKTCTNWYEQLMDHAQTSVPQTNYNRADRTHVQETYHEVIR
jgi:hypothetical protein